jgi:enoyl-CoA hydratase
VSAETVVVEHHGPVLRVRMNRPDKLNAQNPTLITELDTAFAAGAADADVRVIVLSGQGRAFSAGHDLEYPGYDQRLYTDQSRLEMERGLFIDNLLRLRNLPKPTIAQVHGHCVAAGLMLACMCDLIVCDETARFANPVVAMAMPGVQLLIEPWEIGARKAKELTALAARIAAMPPFAVQTVKRSINDALDFMGQGRSWEHHFPLHVAGKRSEEFRQWWEAVEQQGGGFRPGGLRQTLGRRADKP